MKKLFTLLALAFGISVASAQVVTPGPITNNGAGYPVTMASEVGGLTDLINFATNNMDGTIAQIAGTMIVGLSAPTNGLTLAQTEALLHNTLLTNPIPGANITGAATNNTTGNAAVATNSAPGIFTILNPGGVFGDNTYLYFKDQSATPGVGSTNLFMASPNSFDITFGSGLRISISNGPAHLYMKGGAVTTTEWTDGSGKGLHFDDAGNVSFDTNVTAVKFTGDGGGLTFTNTVPATAGQFATFRANGTIVPSNAPAGGSVTYPFAATSATNSAPGVFTVLNPGGIAGDTTFLYFKDQSTVPGVGSTNVIYSQPDEFDILASAGFRLIPANNGPAHIYLKGGDVATNEWVDASGRGFHFDDHGNVDFDTNITVSGTISGDISKATGVNTNAMFSNYQFPPQFSRTNWMDSGTMYSETIGGAGIFELFVPTTLAWVASNEVSHAYSYRDQSHNYFTTGSQTALGGFFGDGGGMTHYESLTIQVATNLTVAFNGTLQKYVITNTPNLFITTAGGHGDASFEITATNNLYGSLFNNPSVVWMAGSNNVVTNTAILSVSSYGTNHIRVAMVQP
jgi:hypothetical protein